MYSCAKIALQLVSSLLKGVKHVRYFRKRNMKQYYYYYIYYRVFTNVYNCVGKLDSILCEGWDKQKNLFKRQRHYSMVRNALGCADYNDSPFYIFMAFNGTHIKIKIYFAVIIIIWFSFPQRYFEPFKRTLVRCFQWKKKRMNRGYHILDYFALISLQSSQTMKLW